MLRPESRGISALLELARMVTSPGHETLGFEDTDGTFYSFEQLKALEGQENNMQLNQLDGIQKAVDSLSLRHEGALAVKSMTRERTVKKCYHFENSFIVIASDDTAWILLGDKGPQRYWSQLRNATTPPLPQGEVF